VEQGATLSRTLTAASTTATKLFFSASGLKGTITVAGTLVCNATCVLNSGKPTPAYLFSANGSAAKVVIKSTANISFSATGECGDSALFRSDVLTAIEDGVTYNGTTYTILSENDILAVID
jgi:hypothetical protein